jgi:hypothetical protein
MQDRFAGGSPKRFAQRGQISTADSWAAAFSDFCE